MSFGFSKNVRFMGLMNYFSFNLAIANIFIILFCSCCFSGHYSLSLSCRDYRRSTFSSLTSDQCSSRVAQGLLRIDVHL